MIRLRPHSTLIVFSASPTRVKIRNYTVAARQHLTGGLLTAHTRAKMPNDTMVLRPPTTLALSIRTNMTRLRQRPRPHSTLPFLSISNSSGNSQVTLPQHFTCGLLTAQTRVEMRNDTIAPRPHSTLALLAAPTRVEIRTNMIRF